MSTGAIIAVVISAVMLAILITFFALLPKKVYFSALFSKSHVSAFTLIGMKFRKIDYIDIVNAYILSKKSNQTLTLADLEIISTTGGHPMNVINGLNAAKMAKLNMSVEFAKALDVSGYNIPLVVESFSKPKIIEIPMVSAITKDQIEMNIKIALTLKIDFKNFLRGVTEDTISTRAMEAIVKKVANIDSAQELLAHPEYIDKAVVDAGIDSESKYEVVSVDVILLDMANDRKFDLEKEEIERQRIIEANKLESRRLTAVAMEQEMKARAAEMKAKAAAAEADVPKAIIKAIEDGKIQDMLDYYKLQEIQADIELKRRMLGNEKEDE